jgi:hypothetical protein
MDRFRYFLIGCGLVSFATAAVIACTPDPAPTGTPLTTNTDKPKKTTGDDDTTSGDDDTTTVKPESDPPLPDGGKPPGRVYAHTADTLYLYDPLIKTLTKIGPFTGVDPGDRMLDIALDRDSVMYGTSDEGLVKIDPTTAACVYIKKDASINYPNALTFVPKGTLDPTKDALVGFTQGVGTAGATKYVRIDTSTGEVSAPLGDLNKDGAPINWKSSGDIIAMSRNGNRAFVTVKMFNPDGGTVDGDPGTDSLAEIDPKTGTIIDLIGDIGQPDFYGLGQWAGTAYGFNFEGNIVEINMVTGQGKTIMSVTDDAGAPVAWFGAGVTTDSPTKP